MILIKYLLLILLSDALAETLPFPQSYKLISKPKIFKLVVAQDQHPLVLKRLYELPVEISKDQKVNFEILITKPLNKLPAFKNPEGYELTLQKGKLTLTGQSEYGLLHGLQTLEQLLVYHEGKLPEFTIKDFPRFPWRGLFIDVVSNWISLETLMKQVDLMAKFKMNVLHLHLSDHRTFRMESLSLPSIHKKNKDRKFFSQAQMKTLIEYAGEKGIRVVPEFSIPGHLDPKSQKNLKPLGLLLKEMSSFFPDEFFQLGGNQNFSKIELEKTFSFLGKKIMIRDDLPKELSLMGSVTQVSRGPKEARIALENNRPLIYSYGYSLDLLLSAETHYNVDPSMELGQSSDSPLVWGGEATMWSERVNDQTITNRIWPRAMAIAERLWSPSYITNLNSFYDRLLFFSRSLSLYEEKLLVKIMSEAPQFGLSSESLGQFLSWIEPGKFSSQYQSLKFNSSAGLDQWADLLPAESLKGTMVNWVFENWDKDRNPESLKLLETTFNSWKGLARTVAPMRQKKFEHKAAFTELARDFEVLSRIASDALYYLKTGEKPGKLWFKENRTRLSIMAKVKAGMQPAMYPLVEKMVHKVAYKHSLSY